MAQPTTTPAVAGSFNWPAISARLAKVRESPLSTSQASGFSPERRAAFKKPPAVPSGLASATPRVGDDVVAFVRVFASGRLEIDEPGQMLVDDGAQFQLREVGVVQPDVVRLAFHRVKVIEAVDKGADDVADVNVVALEVALEND